MDKPSEDLIYLLEKQVTEFRDAGGDQYLALFVDTINKVYKNLTDSTDDILHIRYYREDVAGDINEVTDFMGNPDTDIAKEEILDIPINADNTHIEFEDTLNKLAEIFYGLLENYDDVTTAKEKVSFKADRVEKINEYLNLHIRDLEETIDGIFIKGDKQVDEEE